MKQISIYQVDEIPLGSGGMGRVMRGISPDGREVAIKEILPEFAADFEIRARTEQEVEILQQLNNDSIVKVYDRFPLDGNFYIVMEYVDGLNVEQYVQKYGDIPYERATRFMVKILEAMQAVHESKIVHRDLKPSNIMIRNDERICILDFGIAKDMGNLNGRTVPGTIIGSDGYMSPEQADGFSIDHRADVYALGCVFYFMLTGHHAYNTLANDFETREAIVNIPFPRLSDHSKKKFPNRLQEILDHATDKNMMKRYQSCREFRKDLETLIPSASSSHTVINKNQTEEIFVTIGRENCDIIITDELMKVSRKHLEISYRQFTGGHYYVITDQSSNGTMVNGRPLSRGQSETIPADGPNPQVYLACDGRYPLDWDEVKMHIAIKLKAIDNAETPFDPANDNIQQHNQHRDLPNKQETDHDSNKVTFFGAIRLLFTRAFDFKGRSRRSEYWYVYLFNILLTPIALIINFCALDGVIAMITLFLLGLYFLLAWIPSIALTVRRLHDIGKPWTTILWWLLACIPFVNIITAPVMAIIWIVWMATDSVDDNRWGPNPKR
jgi:serine/threonine-protein kinase